MKKKNLQPLGFGNKAGGDVMEELRKNLKKAEATAKFVGRMKVKPADAAYAAGFLSAAVSRRLKNLSGLAKPSELEKFTPLIENLVEEIPSAIASGEAGRVRKIIDEIGIGISTLLETGDPFPLVASYPRSGAVADPENPRPDEDPYSYSPFEDEYRDRCDIFLDFCAKYSSKEFNATLAKVLLGQPASLSDEVVAKYVKRINGRLDCADFFAIHVVFMLHVNEIHPFLKTSQMEDLAEALIGFKYWVDEPGDDRMITWTENHMMLFHTSEYLAGTMFPDAVFKNNGKTGAEHAEHARALAMQWMERRARWGYCEWESADYLAFDIQSLALLAEFAEDDELSRAAIISLDLLLFDIACNLFYGYIASTQGRAYENDILSGWDNNVAAVAKLVWGTGTFSRNGELTGLILSAAQKYEPPEAIVDIGLGVGDDGEVMDEFLSYQRHGFMLPDAHKFGISLDNLEDAPTIWGTGAFTQPEIIDLLIKAADEWNLWQHPFIDIFGELNKLIPRGGGIGEFLEGRAIESDRGQLGEVNKVVFRTPDYMLSSALDYRTGDRGNQQHIWKAALSPDALVFTTSPGSFGAWDDDKSPDLLEFDESPHDERPLWNRTPTYWVGQNRFPRVAQHRNLAIILYNMDPSKAIAERQFLPFTHAFFPRWAFANIVEENGWIMGRAAGSDGYVALYSQNPYEWKNIDDPFAHDVVSYGLKNVWMCRMGSADEYGDFESFVAKITAAKIAVKDMAVVFEDPDAGIVEFSWDGPFKVAGEEVSLKGLGRFDNPFCKADFDSTKYEINHGGEKLILDVIMGRREIIQS